MHRPPHVNQWKESDFDNFRFIVHELFLCAIAIFIRYERFDQAKYLLEQRYYFPVESDYGRDPMVNYTAFRQPVRSLYYRNKRLNLRRLSVRADLLKSRCVGVGIDFNHLMQADFVLFMRAETGTGDGYRGWWPETLVYVGQFYGSFEIFARASSRQYFDQVKDILGINSVTDLQPLFNDYREGKRRLPNWDFDSFDPVVLLGYEKLATRP
jgi:hypothetical protein